MAEQAAERSSVVFSCDPPPGFSPGIGRYVAQLTETRQELLRHLEGMTPEQLSWHPNDQVESIGTQLLHVAAIEWSWIFEDILGRPGEEYDGWEEALPIRLGLPQVVGRSLEAYLATLNQVRIDALAVLRGLTDEDLPKLRPEQPSEPDGARYTVDWVLFHLVQHEAHHAGQVELMVRLLPPSL
ncbi:MAG TPA: DinB family protein [Thermomicrobiales bacterium]|nr:DinB family protein [Thermomicrobiales bacterium]